MSKIQNLDYETMDDADALEAFVFLNLPELEIKTVSKYSVDLAKLIEWCQNVVSYHILIHPYAYRNENGVITPGSEVQQFAEKMEFLINRFYYFKRFLTKLKTIKIPLADYVFNLQHTKQIIEEQIVHSPFNNLTPDLLGHIFAYLPFQNSFNYMFLSKQLYRGFIKSAEIISYDLYKNAYLFKYRNYNKLKSKLPQIFEYNIHSKYFLMLDDILNSVTDNYGNPFIPFLTKDHLGYIKLIKKENIFITKIAKAFCMLCNIQPDRFSNAKGEIKILYLDKIKKLIINNKLQKLMRQINKLNISENKLQEIIEEIHPFCNLSVLEEIKRNNQGIYQLLIWELLVIEYIQNFNCFDIINIDIDNCKKEVNYFIELMGYLKYNLKVKYYFISKIIPGFEFKNMYERLQKEMINHNMNRNDLFESSNAEHEKIAEIYFKSKDCIPLINKPLFYEKILLKLTSIKEPYDQNNDINDDTCSINDIGYSNKEEKSNRIENSYLNKCNIKMEKIKSKKRSTSQHQQSINSYLNTKSIPQTTFNKSMYNNHGNSNNKLKFNQIPNILIIKHILFYLNVQSLPYFTLANKKCCSCVKTHMWIRLHFLGNEKKLIEQENEQMIKTIMKKKKNYLIEYELEEPNLTLSKQLIDKIGKEDVLNLKFLYKKPNKKSEILIAPFVLLMGKKPKNLIKADGTKQISFFYPAKELFSDKYIVNKIKKFQIETIPLNIYREVVEMLKLNDFNTQSLNHYSNEIKHLLEWVKGVIEAHRFIRKYSFSQGELNSLNEEEINFCEEMDMIDLSYYKLVRYAANYCKQYEDSAKEIMRDMDLECEGLLK